MFKRSLIILGTVLLLQGCAAAVVAGTASAVTAANDRRTIGSQIDDNNIEIKASIAISEDERLNKFAESARLDDRRGTCPDSDQNLILPRSPPTTAVSEKRPAPSTT